MADNTEMVAFDVASIPAMQDFLRCTPPCLAGKLAAMQTDGLISTLPMGAMPTEAERATLTARSSSLERAIAGRGLGERFAQSMTALLSVKALRAGGEATQAVRGAAYRAALADLPESLVVAACEAALKAPSPFAPTPGEIREWVTKALEPLRAEQYSIRQVLRAGARVERSPEERARIKAKVAALAEKLSSRRPAPPPVVEESDDAFRARMHAPLRRGVA